MQKNSTMSDSVGRMLYLLLVLHSVASVVNLPIGASSVGSNGTVVVKAGDHVTFRCSAESKAECNRTCLGWNYCPPTCNSTSKDEKDLNDCEAVYINRSGRIAVETDETVSVLNITGIQPGDAGQYNCHDINSDEEAIVSNGLIVIDDHPRCSSTSHKHFDNKITNGSTDKRRNKTELHCEVGFNGTLNATDPCILEWRIVGREDVLDSECIVGDNSVKSTLALDAASHSNDTSYVCVVRGSAVEREYSCETGQIETPSPKFDEAVATVQPVPTTETPDMKIKQSLYDLLLRHFLNRSSMDRQILHLQEKTLCKMSELAKTQRRLLSFERKRLEELEKSKGHMHVKDK